MTRAADFIANIVAELEMVLFPQRIDGPAGFTDHGRARAKIFLSGCDEKAFNSGFDAAVDLMREGYGPEQLPSTHPQYLRDRSEAYRKAREGAGV